MRAPSSAKADRRHCVLSAGCPGWAPAWGGSRPGEIVRGVDGGQALAELLHQVARQDDRRGLGGTVIVVAADQAAAAGLAVDALDGG